MTWMRLSLMYFFMVAHVAACQSLSKAPFVVLLSALKPACPANIAEKLKQNCFCFFFRQKASDSRPSLTFS